jgi:PDZ domain-containing protein
MFNKLYSKFKDFIKKNFFFILFLTLFYILVNIPLPYYIHTTGGLINVSDKVSIENEVKKSGSLNLSYVTEIRGNVLTYLMSYIMPNWDLVDESDVSYKNETYKEADFRNRMLLSEANQNAILIAYNTANKIVSIKDGKNYIIFVDENANTNLKIGDELLSVDGNIINNVDDYMNIVKTHDIGDKLSLQVIHDNKEQTKYIDVYNYENKKITGIYFLTIYKLDTNPKITINFKESESGPSGGLMMTLSIYNKLIKEDITKGKKIVGTGTIDINGNVGEISGIEYKLKGAVKGEADIFFAPTGNNYNEAVKLKKKNNYKIEIIGVSTFQDALNYLKNM